MIYLKKYLFVLLAGIVLLSLSLGAIVFVKNRKIEEMQRLSRMMEQEAHMPKQPEYIYGLRVDDFVVEEKIIEKGMYFADMLLPFNISFDIIFELSKAAKPFFNTRQFVEGKPYTLVYQPSGTARILKYLIYEKNPVDYVVFSFADSAKVFAGKKDMKIERITAAGIVSSSLFESMTENNLSPQAAVLLSEIFASEIDFHRIRKGDYFKIVIEEKVVEGERIGEGKIIAAQFNHAGKDNFAFRFEHNGKADYYDEKGNSQRKAFLRSPLKFGRLTSGYTMKRFHPVQKRFKAHLGTDYAAPKGTPIMSVGDGVVLEARYGAFNGNYVKIAHNKSIITQYLHMSRFAAGIKPGARVRQGQTIGYVGSTGLSTGPHVCFRYWKNGHQVNHLKEKFATSTPISSGDRELFMQQKDLLMKELQMIEVKVHEKKMRFGENEA